MLNAVENRIMQFLFSKCHGKRTILISPQDILTDIGMKDEKPVHKFEITKKQLEVHMKNILLDGYIDFSHTTGKDGQMIYVVKLTTRGEAFVREHDDVVKRRWRTIWWRLFLGLLTAGASAVITLIIRNAVG